MELEQALEIVKKAVKFTGTIDQKHIDPTLVAADRRLELEQAMRICQEHIKSGQISRDEFNRRVHLEG